MDKIKLQINGFNYELPSSCIWSNDQGEKRASIGAKFTAVMLRQYIKAKYPELTNWVTSESYSGGSSVRVYVCKQDGSKVDRSIIEDLNNLCNSFEAGTFDGMTDSYNYNADVISDYGTRVSFLTKYIFVENKPKWGTLEYMLNESREVSKSLDQFLADNHNWITAKEKAELLKKYEKFKSKTKK